MPAYIASIGMEVHAELATRSKMFCRCEVAFGGEPNTRTCPVCLGMPGTLPVANKAAIEMVIRTALALNCKINLDCHFSRKNYFYPDLPKGYQISQYSDPIGYDGWLDIPLKTGVKRIHIRRVHLEEDTGKLMHLPTGGAGVDYNRAGVPLMEIVTALNPETGYPDIENGEEAKEYLVQLRQILLYLGVCDGKMEEGSLRCEPNVSVRPGGSGELGVKTELKNLNSFRSVQLGVAFEARRQAAVLDAGKSVIQETRGWNEQREESYSMRVKETEQDYRYFPDPDLVPMQFDPHQIEQVRSELPELPLAKAIRYQKEFGLSNEHAGQLVTDLQWALYFEEAVAKGGQPQAIFNWMSSDFAGRLNERGITARESKITPDHLVDLVSLIENGTISGKMGKDLFAEAFETGAMPSELVRSKGLSQLSDEGAIEPLAKQAIEANPAVLQKYKSGQTSVAGYFVGQVMKASGGRAKPELVKEIVERLLENA